MTRKHFIALANEISHIKDDTARRLAAVAVVNASVKLNREFDRDKFYEACNV